MAVSEPFSPPFTINQSAKRYGCYIDYDGTPHEASWTGDWAVFDFTNTLQLCDFELRSIQLTNELSAVWKSTHALAFGSHASVRSVVGGGGTGGGGETEAYPIVKIAPPNQKCRRLIEREFSIMHQLSQLDAVAQIAGEPLVDHDGVFGFRLERLYRVELEDLNLRFEEVIYLLDSLHHAGYCHGDCGLSNIMENHEGRLVLIDLAFAGALDSDLPERFPEALFLDGVYTVRFDRERVMKWAGIH